MHRDARRPEGDDPGEADVERRQVHLPGQAVAGAPRPAANEPGTSGSAFVYLLRCGDGTLYTGWTVDVDARLRAHRAGTGARYTRSRPPVELLAVIEVADRSAALREELRIKGLSRAEKLALVAELSAAR